MEDLKEKSKEVRKIIDNFEQGLLRAGLNADDIDYDILAEVRTECWKNLDNLLD